MPPGTPLTVVLFPPPPEPPGCPGVGKGAEDPPPVDVNNAPILLLPPFVGTGLTGALGLFAVAPAPTVIAYVPDDI